MFSRLLRNRSIGLSPEAKFFLLRFLQEEQKQQVEPLAALDVRKISKRIGVTPKVAALAIDQLVSLGLLAKQSKLRQLGRPSSEYRCDTAEIEKALGDPQGDSRQEARIAKLLSGAVGQEGRRLMYANRLLLAVLVANADDFGVVRGLGWKALSELTGLPRAALRQRLEGLLDQGYLRAVVPGATGTALFKKAKSEYMLNLEHPLLRIGKEPGVLVVRTTFSRHADDYPARQILNAVMKVGGSPCVSVGLERYDVGELFGEANPLYLTPILQASIDRYASYLLSEHFDALGGFGGAFSGLRDRVLKDFSGSDSEEGAPEAEIQEDMIRLLCAQAVAWALDIRAALVRADNLLDEGPFTFCLLPPSKRDHALRGRKEPLALAMLVSAHDGALKHGCRVRDLLAGVERDLVSDDELPMAERYSYGLMTRPKLKS